MLQDRSVDETTEEESNPGRAAERYRRLFEDLPVPLIVWSADDRHILDVNLAALHQFGYRRDEFMALTVDRLVADAPSRSARFPDPLSGDTLVATRRKNGSTFEAEVSGHPLDDGGPARVAMIVDLSDRRQLEAQLHESQKLEAIGRLAGGIAHDFNNLLTAINGYSQLMLASLAMGDPRREDAEQIHLAGKRAAALTGQLLAFSRRQLLQPEVIDVNAVVQDVTPMLRRLIGAHIELTVTLGSRDARVLADRSRLERVVVNLCVNARDAMPRGGSLIIATADREWRVPRHFGDELAAAGAYVELRIRDTGIGMDAETRRRAFEPFFTTKELGQGTGLGLATAYGTVRQSGGHLRVSSVIGKGTSFQIYLPRASETAVTVTEWPTGEAAGGRGTILLVEDEAPVRILGARVLTDAGYAVLPAHDGPSALVAATDHEGPIALLLTDVVMPGESGLEVARAITAARPETRVLYMSGYAEEAVSGAAAVEPGVDFLAKPFTAEQLLAGVRRVIAGRR